MEIREDAPIYDVEKCDECDAVIGQLSSKTPTFVLSSEESQCRMISVRYRRVTDRTHSSN